MKSVNTKRLARLIENAAAFELCEGECDGVSIKRCKTYEPEEAITIVSMRNALMMGQVPTKIKLDYPYDVYQLSYEGGVWMTNEPQELWQMVEPLDNCYGNVFVGGLGLGQVTHQLNLSRRVKHTTTVEIDERIVNLVNVEGERSNVVHADLFDFVYTIKPKQFQSAFFDTWQSTGECEWIKTIVPLKRMCRGLIDNVYCWNEEEMIGQMLNFGGMMRYADIDIDLIPSMMTNYRVFRAKVVELGYRSEAAIQNRNDCDRMIELIAANANDENLVRLATHLCRDVGSDEWERSFGDLWDHYSESYRKERVECQ